MSSLGERFRSAREARGLTLSEVSEQIRIRSVYLAAIEEENWGAIGAPVYARGFIRTYARFLGLDGEAAIASSAVLTSSVPSSGPPSEEELAIARGSERRGSTAWLLWAAGGVALLLIGLVIYNFFIMATNASVVATPPSVAAAIAPSPSASPSAALSASTTSPQPGNSPSASPTASATPIPGAGQLQVAVHATSWIRIEMDGKIVLEGTFPAGTTRVLYGKKAVVRVGNAGGVELDVNGVSIGSLGQDGVVVDRTIPL